jgi:hypothetical protein
MDSLKTARAEFDESTGIGDHANSARSRLAAGVRLADAGAVGEESDDGDAAGSDGMPTTRCGAMCLAPEGWRNSRLEIATQFSIRTARLAREMWTSRASR